jgi:hypothetical protein
MNASFPFVIGEKIPPTLHIAADIFTFAGAFVFAKELWERLGEYREKLLLLELVQRGTVLAEGAETIRNAEDLEFAQLANTRKRAFWGIGLVATGFALSVAAHWLEIFS